jgi:putative ABC transport system permease protein
VTVPIVGALRAWLRRLAAQRGDVLAIAVLMFVTAFVFTLAPRLAEHVADDALRQTIAAAPVAAANLAFSSVDRLEARSGPQPLAEVDSAEGAIEAAMPAGVRALITDRDTIVDLLRWRVESGASQPTLMTLRIEPGATAHLHLTSGHEPTGTVGQVAGPGGAQPLNVYEVAVSNGAARAAGIKVGDTLALRPDPIDGLSARNGQANVAVRVVGLYDADAGSAYWFDDVDLVRPHTVEVSSNVAYIAAAALVSPAAYRSLLEAVANVRYTWHFFVAADRLAAGTASVVATDLRRLETLFPPSAVPTARPALRSGLLRLVSAQLERWQSTRAILSVMAVGPLAAAIGAIALVSLFTHRRRRPAELVWLARGASRPTILAGILVEAGLIALLPAALGSGLSMVLGPGGAADASLVVGAAIGLAGTVLVALPALLELLSASAGNLAAAGAGRVAGRGATPAGSEGAPTAPGRRRLVFEGLIAILALAAAVVIRERGLRTPTAELSVGNALAGIDPIAIAAPTLAGLAGGLLAIRLMAIPLRALAAVTRARRDLVPILGTTRAARGASGPQILLVILLTGAIGSFAAVTFGQIERSADAIAWQATGASVHARAAANSVLPGADVAASYAGVEAAAGAYRGQATITGVGRPLTVLAVDRSIDTAAAATPADPGLPARMTDIPPDPARPLAVIISSGLAQGPGAMKLGETRTLLIGGLRRQIEAIDARPTFPGLPDADSFVVVVRDQLGLDSIHALATTDLFLRTAAGGTGSVPADSSLGRLQAALMAASPGVVLTSADDLAASLRSDPSVASARLGIALACAMAAVYAALAVLLSLALTGASRITETGYLRALGVGRRQIVALVVVEHVPTIVLAVAAGVGLGIAVFALVEPGLGLGALLGSTVDVPLRLDPLPFAALIVSVAVIAVIGIQLAAWLGERLAGAAPRAVPTD